MDVEQLRALLSSVQTGERPVDDAVRELARLPFAGMEAACIDTHRALRQGFSEVIYGESKTAEQILQITEEMHRLSENVLVTRLESAKAAYVSAALPAFEYHPVGRVGWLTARPPRRLGQGHVAIVSAGTADLPVVEECRQSLRHFGAEVVLVSDVGVAGLHRVFAKLELLQQASVIVVVAGMEGALASVVGGLVGAPIIAVPTSVGYGAAQNGMTTLLAMLTSCASGVTVCNIDNGFGAAFAAARILRAQERV